MLNYNEGQLHANKNNQKEKKHFFSCVKYIIIFTILSYVLASIGNTKKDEEVESFGYLGLLSSEKDVERIIEKLEKRLNIEIEDSKKDEYLLLNAIDINSNLEEKVKNVFYGYHSIVEECIYMNREAAYESLSTVSIEYKERDENIQKSTLGDYSYVDKKINIYEDDSENSVLLHEGIHCMFYNNQTEKLPKSFTEGVTELLTKEYFSIDPFYIQRKYPYEVAYIKMLCEIVGTNLVLKAYSIGDFTLITDYMDQYNSTGISSKEILQMYEDAFEKIEDKSNINLPIDKNIVLNVLDKIYMGIHPELKEYKAYKYISRLTMCIYEKDPLKFYSDFIKENGILQKAYFSNELQAKCSSITFKSTETRDKILTRGKQFSIKQEI